MFVHSKIFTGSPLSKKCLCTLVNHLPALTPYHWGWVLSKSIHLLMCFPPLLTYSPRYIFFPWSMMKQKQRFYRNHSHEYKERMLARPAFPSKKLDITVLRRCEEERWSGRGGTEFAHNGQSSLGWLCRLLFAQRCSAKQALKPICALLPRRLDWGPLHQPGVRGSFWCIHPPAPEGAPFSTSCQYF